MASHSLDDDVSPLPESGSQAGSGDGILPAQAPSVEADSSSGVDDDAEFGFQRTEVGKGPLVGTVQRYDRHLFLCYKSPEAWPPRVEEWASDSLPRFLAGEIKKWASTIDKKTRLTICEGVDGTDFSNGDVLIFPDMIRYRGLTHVDVEQFVDEVLKKNSESLPITPGPLSGSYVFVCAHASRDRRCGVCGPILILRFKEEISSRGLQGQIFVSPCSHIGGHKYAGNVIIFSPNANGEVTGHWYGYVTPDDVPILLEQHIGKGKIVDHLWRGQMGLSEDDQKTAQQFRLQLSGGLDQNTCNEIIDSAEVNGGANVVTPSVGGCCQGTGNATCCQVMPEMEKLENHNKQESQDFVQKSSDKDNKEMEVNGCASGVTPSVGGCCQGTGNATCCQVMPEMEKLENHNEQESQDIVEKSSGKDNKASSSKRSSTWKLCSKPNWLESWEREGTSYAALAVVAAVTSVAIAYSYYYKKHG